MEDSRIGTVIMAFPLVILVLTLVISLYNVGFDVEAATLPENPVGPLSESLSSLLQEDGVLVTGIAVETDSDAGTVTLRGVVQNPTTYPLTVRHIEYRIPGEDSNFTASLAAPVTVPPGGNVEVVLIGDATPDALFALESGSAKGMLFSEIEIMGISVTTEIARPWVVKG